MKSDYYGYNMDKTTKFRENRNLGYFVEKFSWSRSINHTPIHTTRRFVDKYFVVRFSTTKTTKILPLKNYPLYGMYGQDNLIRNLYS